MVAKIIGHVFETVYEIAGVSLLLGVLFMFAWLYLSEHGRKEGFRRWMDSLKTDPDFRKMFIFALYAAMLLCKTLLARRIWHDPFRNVIGIWGFYDEKGELYTENFENILLFVPYLFLLFRLWKNTSGERAG